MRLLFVRSVTAALVVTSLVVSCGSDAETPAAAEPATPEPTIAAVTPMATRTTAVDEAIGADGDDDEQAENDGLYPTVVDAAASTTDGTTWRFDVTLSSEYDSPARYADAWRVLDAADNELGIRVLTHDHANEQPFTRSTSVEIADSIDIVFIEGRDQRNGWSGQRFELHLDR